MNKDDLEVGEIFGSRYYIKQTKTGNVEDVRFNIYQEMSPGGVQNVINSLRRSNRAYSRLSDKDLVLKITEERFAFLYKYNLNAESLSMFRAKMKNLESIKLGR